VETERGSTANGGAVLLIAWIILEIDNRES
jgi:hypothetical protein